MPFPSLLYYYYLPCAADPAPPADTANNTYVDNLCSNAVLCRICRRPSREKGAAGATEPAHLCGVEVEVE
jgi:hypothetical protein